MEKVKKELQVLMTIDNIRVIGNDDQNVVVERYEKVFIPKTKQKEYRWTFIGYSRSIRTALEMIVNKELLIDKNAVSDLNSHLEHVRESNDKILAQINRLDVSVSE